MEARPRHTEVPSPANDDWYSATVVRNVVNRLRSAKSELPSHRSGLRAPAFEGRGHGCGPRLPPVRFASCQPGSRMHSRLARYPPNFIRVGPPGVARAPRTTRGTPDAL